MLRKNPLKNETELLARCQEIEGLTLAQLAIALNLCIPNHPLQRKGWAGQAIELALGATAGTHPQPDFFDLGIELKSLPINHLGKPAESTFVTTISLLTIHQETWATSQCFAKIKRILWLPIEADKCIPYAHRRIGRAILWSPSKAQEAVLAEDWSELSWMISSGRLAEMDASMGRYLQVRPKAANSKSLCYGYDESGEKTLTLPRGFYLRSSFTATVLHG
ncbi:DNA mismatch repair endonuclease MutH [Legionella nagasakiensis]|uniref:DNA mismatch repair endonuclease MutH n=1 Tax=Legionella nagasakiensis TaxID=535290 RepID=UPI0010554400|nr:DNA mismatch repair endonuclease MutH [Legionella nagasakiensis]